MPITIAIPKETAPGEKRVAMIPDVAKKLKALGADVAIQTGAGTSAFFPDSAYAEARFVPDEKALLASATLLLKVQPPTEAEIGALNSGATVLSFMAPGKFPERVKMLLDKKITTFSMELVPRITRAQSMDALSSQASVTGYQAVLMAAQLCPKFFPMLTTAAGTIRPAKALIIGAGVAGLQAIATARRLGAVVEAYDVRSAAKEQVESLGAKFVTAVQGAEGGGGYARELTEDEKRQQQEVLAKHVAGADALITTAAIPGRPAPKIITAAMVAGMKPGAVIVDLAAESGGNCELCQPGKTIVTDNGVTIHGPLNMASTMPLHASEMYAKNLLSFCTLFVKDGNLTVDWDDEIIKGSLYTKDGQVMHEPSKKALGLG